MTTFSKNLTGSSNTMDQSGNSRRTLTVLQHNVMTWTNKRHTLTNIYREIDADIILLNETSILEHEPFKIYRYNTYKTNTLNQRHAGAAIAIKNTLQARVDETFEQDFLTVTLHTGTGPITIATGYIPPRTGYINTVDLHRIFNRDHPNYFFGNLNANHRQLGYTTNNTPGMQIINMIDNNKCTHIGPQFSTRITATTCRSPDIALSNSNAFLNTYLSLGPLTPSDHIPIVIKISADPIQIPIRPRLQFSKTNWPLYKQLLSHHTTPELDSLTPNDIDKHITQWTDAIQEATNKTTPLISYRKIPGIQPNKKTPYSATTIQTLAHNNRQPGPFPSPTTITDDIKNTNHRHTQTTLQRHMGQNC